MKNSIGLVVQTVLAVAILAFAFLYFVEYEFLIVLQAFMAFFMFVLAYNNITTFKRDKKFTVAYIVVGILILGAMIF